MQKSITKTRQRRRIQCRKGTQRRTSSKKSRRGGIANVNGNGNVNVNANGNVNVNANATAWCDINGCLK